MDGWMNKTKDHTATKPRPLRDGPMRNLRGAGAEKQTVSHMEHTQVKLPLDQSRTTQHPHQRGGMEVEGWGLSRDGQGELTVGVVKDAWPIR